MTDDFAEHINRMDRDKQAQDALLAQKDMERRRARWQAIGGFLIALAVAAGVVGVSVVVWLGVRGPSADDIIQQEDRQACIEAGGTYTYVNGAEKLQSCTMQGVSTR